MRFEKTRLFVFLSTLIGVVSTALAGTTNNQTDTLSPVLSQAGLPFQVRIEQADFQLPVGLHSGAAAIYKGLWVFIAGRLNGLHGFQDREPFPPDEQNTSIYVVNPVTHTVLSRSLTDPGSGLTPQQIDTLSVTSPESYQDGPTLYIAGGYGVQPDNSFDTKPVLTAINLPGIIEWVTNPDSGQPVSKNIRQINNPVFQVTGGRLYKVGNNMQLVFGQNFTGVYTDSSNGEYSEQVRLFRLNNANGQFGVQVFPSKPAIQDPNYRRRDLNILPALLNINNRLQDGLIAYAGVFTPATGVWTVPVVIDSSGNPTMADPNGLNTFKQAMNHYTCASASLYSRKSQSMYHVFFGGVSYGFYSGGVFETDAEIPFINEVTTIQMDQSGNFTQYLMNNEYPFIPASFTNPGNPLLFGAGAYFMPTHLSQYSNRVINLDNIREPTVIGYIVGGIMSTLPNTIVPSDSAASPFIFKVTLIPNN